MKTHSVKLQSDREANTSRAIAGGLPAAGDCARRQKGFTLLEVIVALAITGFVLGSLFTLVAGSKRLSFRSEESLVRAARLRAATNFALLENDYNDIELVLEDDSFLVNEAEFLEDPVRKTSPSTRALQKYEVVNSNSGEVITGLRWIQLELPQ